MPMLDVGSAQPVGGHYQDRLKDVFGSRCHLCYSCLDHDITPEISPFVSLIIDITDSFTSSLLINTLTSL